MGICKIIEASGKCKKAIYAADKAIYAADTPLLMFL